MPVETARKFETLGLAAVLFGLSACMSLAGVRIDNADISSNYRPKELGIVSGGDRALRVEVVNNAFRELPAEFVAEKVVSSMQARARGYRVNFSLDPEIEYRPESRYRVLMVFDPPRSLPSIGLCRRDDLAAAARRQPDDPSDPARVRVLGAYCQGDTTLTRATGTAPRGADPSDPTFDALISQMTMTLFPIKNPHLEDNRCAPYLLWCR